MKKEQKCTVDVTLKVLGGKWKPLILWYVADAPIRFNQLQRQIPGITQKMLAQQLREMERDGLVKRQAFAEVPPRVEYSLTPHGRTLQPLIESMSHWGQLHQSRA